MFCYADVFTLRIAAYPAAEVVPSMPGVAQIRYWLATTGCTRAVK